MPIRGCRKPRKKVSSTTPADRLISSRTPKGSPAMNGTRAGGCLGSRVLPAQGQDEHRDDEDGGQHRRPGPDPEEDAEADLPPHVGGLKAELRRHPPEKGGPGGRIPPPRRPGIGRRQGPARPRAPRSAGPRDRQLQRGGVDPRSPGGSPAESWAPRRDRSRPSSPAGTAPASPGRPGGRGPPGRALAPSWPRLGSPPPPAPPAGSDGIRPGARRERAAGRGGGAGRERDRRSRR